MTNQHSHLPVYTNIHRIRRDIISVVEDYLSLEQLRDVRINVTVIRPLVDKFYELDDISISMPCFISVVGAKTLTSSQFTACWSTVLNFSSKSLTPAHATM